MERNTYILQATRRASTAGIIMDGMKRDELRKVAKDLNIYVPASATKGAMKEHISCVLFGSRRPVHYVGARSGEHAFRVNAAMKAHNDFVERY